MDNRPNNQNNNKPGGNNQRGGRNSGGRNNNGRGGRGNSEYLERVIQIKRTSKKTTGGNAISFSALCIVGDRKSKVGVALGKAPDVASAIRKGMSKAKKDMFEVPIENGTIPHRIEVKRGAARILLKPAPKGTGVRAGGPVRAVVEAAGLGNIVSKIIGTKNKVSNVYATAYALQELKGK